MTDNNTTDNENKSSKKINFIEKTFPNNNDNNINTKNNNEKIDNEIEKTNINTDKINTDKINTYKINPNKINEKNETNQINLNNENKQLIFSNFEENQNYRMLLKLKQIGEKSMGYRWMHNKCTEYHDDRDNFLQKWKTILIWLSDGLDSTIFISLLSINNLDNNKLVASILVGITMVISFLLTIIDYFVDSENNGKLTERHKQYSNRYGKINSDIQQHFILLNDDSLSKHRNEETKYFYIRMQEDYNNLLDGQPDIRKQIKEQYIKSVGDIDIAKPINAGEFEEIDIVIQYNNNNKYSYKSINKNKDNDDNKKKIDLNTKENNKSNLYKDRYQIDRWLRNF